MTLYATKLLCAFLVALMLAGNASAQYFGKNKVAYESFDFKVLETEHFDIYYYDDSEESIEAFGRLAERWHRRLSLLFDGALTGRQPLIVYASHPHFRQTNVVPSQIGEATGGLTEFLKNRIVMPFMGTLAETDHVLGHELVHAFQYAATGRGVDRDWPGSVPAAAGAPLWLSEGMAEYLSVGPTAAHKAMWMRDAMLRDELPSMRDLRNPRYNPYQIGHAFMAYIGGRSGDRAVVNLLTDASERRSLRDALPSDPETLADEWHESVRSLYGPVLDATKPAENFGSQLREGRENGRRHINLGPALSPDGTRMAYLSERVRGALELYVMDVDTGEDLRRLTSVAVDPHFDSLQFTRSSGTWHPEGTAVALAAVSEGQPVLTLVDADSGETTEEIRFPELGEIYNPSWSPDGGRIAFSANVRGFTDLYIYDLEQGQLERLTDDLYSVLQPSWSPDGNRLAFATDRFTTDLERLIPGEPRIAIMDLPSGALSQAANGPGKQINPQWSANDSLYFISDADGISNIYRLAPGATSPLQLTNVQTGVSGVTPESPALSVASEGDRMAFTVFDGGGYSLFVADGSAAEPSSVPAEAEARERRILLPPEDRRGQVVADYLSDPTAPPTDPVISRRGYEVDLDLDFITPPTITAAGGSSGSFAAGSIGALWSDMLGNHQVSTQLNLVYADDELVRNSSATLTYLNSSRRFNWGGSIAQIPQFSGRRRQAVTEVDGEPVLLQEATRVWEMNREATGLVAYPLSRASRVEFTGGVRNISFDVERELQTVSLNTGRRIDRRNLSVSDLDSLNLGTAAIAHVYDTSLFGGTAPILGQRSRVEVTGAGGDLEFNTGRVDYRHYWMPFEGSPFSIGTRLLHFGRYGTDAEDPRLSPLFLGSTGLVRGYESRRFNLIADPSFNQLQGSRIAVGNLEFRLPLAGPQGIFGSGFGPPVDGFTFYDTGVAWTKDQDPAFAGGERSAVASYGAGLRLNLGGFIVFEFAYVNPEDREDRNGRWQLRLTPGF